MNQEQAAAGLKELDALSAMMSAQIDEALVSLAACQERFQSSFRRFRIIGSTIEAMPDADAVSDQASVTAKLNLAAD